MKPIQFHGSTLQVIRAFPVGARRSAGHQLDRIQRGLDPLDWKPMNRIGRGVRELRIRDNGQYRIIYLAVREEAVHVLHAFRKKARKTRQRDMDIARSTFKRLVN